MSAIATSTSSSPQKTSTSSTTTDTNTKLVQGSTTTTNTTISTASRTNIKALQLLNSTAAGGLINSYTSNMLHHQPLNKDNSTLQAILLSTTSGSQQVGAEQAKATHILDYNYKHQRNINKNAGAIFDKSMSGDETDMATIVIL